MPESNATRSQMPEKAGSRSEGASRTQQPRPGTAGGSARTGPSDLPKSRRTGRRLAPGLIALSSAAILSVYAAGYIRTEGAADLLLAQEQAAARTTLPLPRPSPTLAAVLGSVEAPAPTSTPTARPAPTLAPAVAPSGPSTSARTARSARPSPTPAPTSPTRLPPPTAQLPQPTPSLTPAPERSAAPAAATSGQYRDGTYVGTGRSRHGSVTATVVVQGGKIVSAQITGCATRYPCSDIASLPTQVVAQQAPPVDVVSGATDSSLAYAGAVANALAQAT